jgi:hypothetical protein
MTRRQWSSHRRGAHRWAGNGRLGAKARGLRPLRTGVRALVAGLTLASLGTVAPAGTVAASASGLSSPQTYSGALGGTSCTYSVKLTWTDPVPDKGNLSASVSCGARVSVALTGSWDGTTVTLKAFSGSFDGHKLPAQAVNAQLSPPDNPTVDPSTFSWEIAGEALSDAQDAVLKSPWTFGPQSFGNGQCSYKVQASWTGSEPSSGTLSGTVGCKTANVSLSLSATYADGAVTLNTVSGSVAGIDLSQDSIGSDLTGQVISLPFDPSGDLDDLVGDAAAQLPGTVADEMLSNGPEGFANGLINPIEQAVAGSLPSALLNDLNQWCASKFLYNDPVADCNNPFTKQPQGLEQTFLYHGPGAKDLDDSEATGCPQLGNDPPPDLFVICVPVILAGDFNAGNKEILLVPGGSIVAAPIGASLGAPTVPTMETKGSVLMAGGAIEGLNLSMSAGKSISLAGMDISMLGSLQVKAGTYLSIGQFSTQDALGLIPKDLSTLVPTSSTPSTDIGDAGDGADGITPPELPSGREAGFAEANAWTAIDKALTSAVPAVTLPAEVWASNIKLTSGALTVASGSTVSSAGLGQEGALMDGRILYKSGPYALATAGGGGAFADYGGSHIGYGGYPVNSADTDWTDTAYGPGPRGNTFDNPYFPALPGGGGGGYNDGEAGLPGGGVISVTSTSLILNGTLSADGDSQGGSGSGGGGAGGTINIDTGSWGGNGALEANGGGHRWDNTHLGGFGGGGAVAVHYTSDRFSGAAMAHGGFNASGGNNPVVSVDLGGAGTVFLEKVAKAPSATGTVPPQDTSTRPSAGTLVVDGDTAQSAGYEGGSQQWPPTDATPLPPSWSDKNVVLDITGAARVYATNIDFAKVAISDDGVLTAGTRSQDLTVNAGQVDVGPTGRIDMSGHGYAGGTDAGRGNAAGQSAPRVGPADHDNGGSHGGQGGSDLVTPKGKPGATYDQATDPTLPGGGGGGGYGNDDNTGTHGGGVVFITAGTVQDNGVIAADGQDEDGPVASFPFINKQSGAGAGAGGSVQVHVRDLTGNGSIEARGGDLNMPSRFSISRNPTDNANFNQQDGAGGAGGGGDILVVAGQRSGFTGTVSAAGGTNYRYAGSVGHPGHVTYGR